MPLFTKECLERLREHIDLVEVLSPYVDLKRTGASYKALCPFHEERSPSFVVQKGDTHYHCFGCGAHGDAIAFLMQHRHLTFMEAVETLAERFQVPLQFVEGHVEEGGVDKRLLKDTLETASLFFHFHLLNSEEGKEPLRYLLSRHLTLDFIKRFEVGLAPATPGILTKVMEAKGFKEETLLQAGLLGKEGKKDFFRERITFPIRNAMGSVIGFSARKYRESTFGGKYINTYETPLFKKSRILFGLNYCRTRIAKERRAMIVEGQIDCLKMIEAGLDLTVASLGTAFGKEHVHELKTLGVNKVALLFDGDEAGLTASCKVGHLFQQVGIEVKVVRLPSGLDPDGFLVKFGTQPLIEEIKNGQDYLSFRFDELAKQYDIRSPALKTELIKQLSGEIREWEEALMVHESLKRLASLAKVPEEMLGVDFKQLKPFYLHKTSLGGKASPTDFERILEMDLIRLLVLTGEEFPEVVTACQHYLRAEYFQIPVCAHLFVVYLEACATHQPRDLLSLVAKVPLQGIEEAITEILNKKIKRDRAYKMVLETIQKLLDRKWLAEREEIKIALELNKHSEAQVSDLLKRFNDIKRPVVTESNL